MLTGTRLMIYTRQSNSYASPGGDDMVKESSLIKYKCPSCGTTSKRIDVLRGRAMKCYRCGMLMLEVM
jgi:predicted RNA-binding Zn-ribbon protein involved in translation (DUF1610 family)